MSTWWFLARCHFLWRQVITNGLRFGLVCNNRIAQPWAAGTPYNINVPSSNLPSSGCAARTQLADRHLIFFLKMYALRVCWLSSAGVDSMLEAVVSGAGIGACERFPLSRRFPAPISLHFQQKDSSRNYISIKKTFRETKYQIWDLLSLFGRPNPSS